MEFPKCKRRIGEPKKVFLDKYNFLEIKEYYYIAYKGEVFNMQKASDIRSLCYLLNMEKGYTERECENNEVEDEKSLIINMIGED